MVEGSTHNNNIISSSNSLLNSDTFLHFTWVVVNIIGDHIQYIRSCANILVTRLQAALKSERVTGAKGKSF